MLAGLEWEDSGKHESPWLRRHLHLQVCRELLDEGTRRDGQPWVTLKDFAEHGCQTLGLSSASRHTAVKAGSVGQVSTGVQLDHAKECLES